MLKFLPCYQAVESMRLGASPEDAANDALDRIYKFGYHAFQGALITMDHTGAHAGATRNMPFSYAVNTNGTTEVVKVKNVETMAPALNDRR